MRAIVRKELADYFSSMRFFVLFVLTIGISAVALYAAYQGMRSNTDTSFVFLRLFDSQIPNVPLASLLVYPNLMAMFFIPLMGISLGFDAINSERTSGTLSRLMAQPVYRDGIINAKFIAGIFALILSIGTSMLLIGGYGLRMIGVPPDAEEIIRLFLFGFFMVILGAFWMSLAILFSTLFRRVASSLLSSVGIWLVFGVFFVFIIGFTVSSPSLSMFLSRISPTELLSEAASVLLVPQWRGLELLTAGNTLNYMIPNPLTIGQSVTIVWPQLIALVAITVICAAVSYLIFMRQEVRST